ncbi:MAG: hypothetical protein GY862_29185 [Gammaproteobacteria bacterium]|nr:hypothetical protein [Gammaproteobacteria bacterium]
MIFRGDQVRFGSEEGRAAKVIAEVFVSLANTGGGVVLFGIDKRGEVSGVDSDKKDILEQFVVNCALQNCMPALEPRLDWLFLPNQNGQERLCLKVLIAKSRFYVHQTADGRFLKRAGSHRTPIPAEQLGRLLVSRELLAPYEERPAIGTHLDNLNRDRFSRYYERRFGVSVQESNLPLEKILANLKLAIQTENGVWQLSNLGVLLFTYDPSRHLPGAYVDIAAYDRPIADGNTLDSRIITGAVPEQIENTLTYFRSSALLPISSRKDEWGRRDQPRYSLSALQEAVVNALIHRDYELNGSQVIVTLFPDRIEIKNPGGLHNTLTPENLYAGCQPMRRNQYLTGFMRDYISPVTQRSYMEARGEGFLNLVRESEKLSGKKPLLETIGHAVKLTIYAKEEAS